MAEGGWSTRAGRTLSHAVPYLVFPLALLVLMAASRATAPAFDELVVLGHVERAEELVRAIARTGVGELASPGAKQLLDGKPALLVLSGAWSALSLGRQGIVDPLTALRLPWLVLGALGCWALYVLAKPSLGRATALLGVVVLLLVPRWVHSVVVLREGALLGSTWLLVLACYVRSLGPSRRTACWAAGGALALGFGAALSLATLWVLVPLCLHHALVRPGRTRRLLGRALVPAPPLVLYALPLAPLAVAALSPSLWRASPAQIARFVLAPLAPSVAPAAYAGRIVDRLPVPAGYGPSWLVQTLPAAIALAGLFGAAFFVHALLARRFASGRLRPPADRHGVGLLAALALGAALIGPALAPRVLVAFPPRVELCLPFVAVFAALGFGRIARVRGGLGRAAVVLVLVALAPGALAAGTAGSSFTPLWGGARRVVASRALPAGDGSELGALLPALAREASAVATPPDVPAELWRVLARTRRTRSQISIDPGAAFELVRGKPASGTVVAEARRDGAVLWTLVRR